MRKLLLFLFVSTVSTATTASAVTLSLINLPNPVGGRDNVIQVTGALTGNVQGGPVTGDTQTIYYWANDGANTAPQYGLTASRSGGERTAWPVVFVPSGTSVTVGEGITASVSLGASQQVNPYDAALPSPLYRFRQNKRGRAGRARAATTTSGGRSPPTVRRWREMWAQMGASLGGLWRRWTRRQKPQSPATRSRPRRLGRRLARRLARR